VALKPGHRVRTPGGPGVLISWRHERPPATPSWLYQGRSPAPQWWATVRFGDGRLAEYRQEELAPA